MKSVSVAMATYNGARYLAEQLHSLAKQSRLPAELVVTDDGSTDETLTILADFARAAPFPLRVHRNEQRLGYRANFMKAARLCESDVISFCDQDDVWLDSKLQRCVEQLETTDALLVYHNATVTTSELVPIDTLAKDGLPTDYHPALSIGPLTYGLGFTLVFDRQLLEFHPLWEQSLDFNDGKSHEGHDQWFFFVANVFGAVAYLDSPLALYRRHTAATTQTTWAGASMLARMVPYLVENPYLWNNYAHGCQRRAELLEQIAARDDTRHARAARAGAEKYRVYSQLYRDRLALYTTTAILPRMRLFAGIAAAGGYRNADVWAKGRKSAVKDLVAGVLGMGPLLRRLSDRPSQAGL
jgi:glycosyltransferase involved in cell wall biosynthesis